MRFQQRSIGIGMGTVLGTLIPATCSAAAGAQALAGFIELHLVQQALFAFWGISAAAIFYYAVRMVLEAYKDESYTNLSNAFINVLSGFAVIACASAFAAAFYTPGLSADNAADISPTILGIGVQSVADFIITMSAGIFVLMVVIAGIGMVTSRGDSGAFEKWRKILIANIVGVVVMFVAFYIVHAVSDINSGLLIEEMRGLALFLLTLLGFMCVVALIVAGVLLIVSVDESLRDKAKNIIIGTLITLALVVLCYTLIVTFVRTTAP